MTKKMQIFSIALVSTVWLGLAGAAWFSPAAEVSDSERRQLAQFPEITAESVLDGSFMADFESYTLDQFPSRDTFRRLKAQIRYNLLGQQDNNGIYLAQGHAAALVYPRNDASISNAISKFNFIYETYLQSTSSRILLTLIPDKGHYLAQENGYPALDYGELFDTVQSGTPWAEFVDISDLLTADDYYSTDIHWRQERIVDVAQRLCHALEVTPPETSEFTAEVLARPFYGVYYGQAALPMAPDTITLLTSEKIENCTVFQQETGKTSAVYDRTKLSSRDLYDVYLSGATPLLTLTNPNATTTRELIVFRDSFSSSLVPLILSDYSSVTLVDIRYVSSSLLGQFVDFHGQDVLFAYSVQVINDSGTLK